MFTTLTACAQTNQKMKITVNGHTLTATLADNSSARALVELLQQGDVIIHAHDYGGFEKVGDLPQSLPQNNEQITTVPGDIILYVGSSICFYYARNSWNFTRLGKIDNAANLDLKSIYGNGNVTFVLSLDKATGIKRTSTEQEVRSQQSYHANGSLASEKTKGMIINRTVLADGTIKVSKTVKK